MSPEIPSRRASKPGCGIDPRVDQNSCSRRYMRAAVRESEREARGEPEDFVLVLAAFAKVEGCRSVTVLPPGQSGCKLLREGRSPGLRSDAEKRRVSGTYVPNVDLGGDLSASNYMWRQLDVNSSPAETEPTDESRYEQCGESAASRRNSRLFPDMKAASPTRTTVKVNTKPNAVICWRMLSSRDSRMRRQISRMIAARIMPQCLRPCRASFVLSGSTGVSYRCVSSKTARTGAWMPETACAKPLSWRWTWCLFHFAEGGASKCERQDARYCGAGPQGTSQMGGTAGLEGRQTVARADARQGGSGACGRGRFGRKRAGLVVIEAMKMQNELKSPKTGTS